MVFWESRPELESPDLFLAEGPSPRRVGRTPNDSVYQKQAGSSSGLSGPRSRGRIVLTGADPDDRVRIDANALPDPKISRARSCASNSCARSAVPQCCNRTSSARSCRATHGHRSGGLHPRRRVNLLAPGRYGQDGQRLHVGGRRPSRGLWSREPSSRRRLHHAEDNDGQHNGTVRSDRRTSSGTAHQRAPPVTAARSYPNLPAPSSISSSDDTRT
jgi:hypothetical protein